MSESVRTLTDDKDSSENSEILSSIQKSPDCLLDLNKSISKVSEFLSVGSSIRWFLFHSGFDN